MGEPIERSAVAAPNATGWKGMGAAARREVFRLASTGERHPDPHIAEAAAAWAHSARWDRVPNRIPGWVLPALGVFLGVVFLVLQLPLLALGAGLVVVLGVLGWASTAGARALRRVYAPPAPESSPRAPAAPDGRLEVLEGVLGAELTSVQRLRYVVGDEVGPEDGPLQLRFASGEVRRFDAGADGEVLAVATSAWVDPFAEPLSDENRAFVARSGRWVGFDVSAETPYSAAIGTPLAAYTPLRTAEGELVGVVLAFGALRFALETHGADELHVTATPAP